VFTTARETGDCAAHATDPPELLTAVRTAIDEARCISPGGKWQIVTALFVGDSQVDARLSPLSAVRQNSLPASAKLGENMCQLMSQRAIDFNRVFA
jgi:hypothetical protein